MSGLAGHQATISKGGGLARAARKLGRALFVFRAPAPEPARPMVSVRRVTLDAGAAPKRLRPVPPAPPRRTLAIGPYAPRASAGGKVIALDRGRAQHDNLFRDDFAG